VRGCDQFLDRHGRRHARNQNRPRRDGGAGGRALTLSMGEPVKSGRRDQDRHRRARSEQADLNVRRSAATQYAWDKPDPDERGLVLAHGDFVIGAAGKIIEHHRIKTATRFGLEIAKVHARPTCFRRRSSRGSRRDSGGNHVTPPRRPWCVLISFRAQKKR
jgi:hypothetical protein